MCFFIFIPYYSLVYLQILNNEPQKSKHSRPILGMLQTSQALLHQSRENTDQNYNTDNIDGQNHVDALGGALNDNMNTATNLASDKNPMINKRILLKMNYEPLNSLESDFVPADLETESNDLHNRDNAKQSMYAVRPKVFKPDATIENENDPDDGAHGGKQPKENVIYEKMKLNKPLPSNDDSSQNHGRIVIYGDSNCLDSTHMEKPCFWLLDALLEFTMSSHVSTVLKDLNHSPNIQFPASSMSTFPKRLPNNHLHLYSKVLMPQGGSSSSSGPSKRSIPKCDKLWWDTPIFLNVSASNVFHGPSKDDRDSDSAVGELNLRRKLESQKGEVRRC